MVLQHASADDLRDRLTEVNRTFTAPLVVSPFPSLWDQPVIAPNEVLDIEVGAHDHIHHALSLHWCEDPVGQIIQCRRGLAPDGLFTATLFGGETLTELRVALATAETEIRGGLSPRVAPMGDIRDLGALLQRGGLALPVADSYRMTLTYAHPFDLMRDLRRMGEGNALNGRSRGISRRALFQRAAEIYITEYGSKDRVPATFEFVTLTGWAQDESQPQPLRPGSATARLADVLNTEETVLKDR